MQPGVANTTSALTVDASCQVITLTQPDPLTVTISGSDATICNGQSAPITVSVTGGTAPYVINGVTQTGAGPFTINESPTSTTTYDNTNVTVTDAHSCTSAISGSVLLTVNPVPTLTGATQSVSVCTGSAAVINLTGLLAGSTSTISYTINGAAQTPVTGVVADGSGAASFNTPNLSASNNGQILQITGITVTSATPNCTKSFAENVTLAVNQLITVGNNGTETDATCNRTFTGAITLGTISGGNGVYTITWSSPGGYTGSGTTITDLAADSYEYSITDNSCPVVTGTINVGEPDGLSATVASTQPSCNGTDDGSITISSPSGGYGTFEYSIDGGAHWQASGNFTGLAPNTYDVQIRDAAHTDCVTDLDAPQEIAYPVVLSATVANTQPTCNGTDDGSITISSAAGGYGTYEYSIDGGAHWQASGSFTGLAPNTYDVKIRDAAHTACVIDLGSQVIAYPVVLSATVANTQPTCNGTDDGSITISSPAGGYGTYEYSIDGGAHWQASGSFTGLAPNTYDVKIRDAAHTACVIDLGSQVIAYPVVLSATVANTQPTCNGTDDGSITISSPAGGYGTYEYSIDGGAHWQASGSFTGLAPNTYDVKIRDAAHTACVIDLGSQVIAYPVVLSATVANTQPTCNGTDDGSITISSPAGGYGTYEYSIDGGAHWQASGSFTGLAPHTYDVKIRDAAHTACVIDLGNTGNHLSCCSFSNSSQYTAHLQRNR